MKKTKENVLIFLFLYLVFLIGCNSNIEGNNKKIAISCLGIKADMKNYYAPGEKVEVFAMVNKRNDVLYEWKLSGIWKEISLGKIEWILPNDDGNYKVMLTVTDLKTQEKASKSLEVNISDSYIQVAPETFSCTTKTKIHINNKMTGENEYITVSSLSMNSEGVIQIETKETDGTITRTYADSEALYSVDEAGNKTFVTKCINTDILPTADVISLSSLKNVCDKWETNGRQYTFLQKNETDDVLVEYDSTLGVVTRLKEERIDQSEVSDIRMVYDVINGFIVPTKISGIVTSYILDEKFETTIEEEITDIVINGGEE